ncbi:autotransporter domain-containing protein [Pelagibacterales bacterium]|nr:autotransporter domain-containing protein [Pelagibacterales bacterium]
MSNILKFTAINIIALNLLLSVTTYKVAYAEMSSLGVLAGGSYSYAQDVSSDGSVIVGISDSTAGRRAFKYDSTNGMTSLGVLTGGSFSYAYRVSSDGSVIVGYSGSTNGTRAFKYDSTNGMTSLGVLLGGSSSIANGVSSDGSVIVGYSRSTDGYRAFKYDSTNGMTSLGVLAGGSFSRAYGVSGDGSVIVGYSDSTAGRRAFKYDSTNGMTSLGVLTGGSSSYAYRASGDGSVIVGYSDSTDGYRAFKYDSTNGMTNLGVLTGGSASYGMDVSSDGSVIVGYSGSTNGTRAFKYDSTNGMTSLGVLTGGSSSYAYGVSSDGSVIVGESGSTAGTRAFIYRNVMLDVTNTTTALATTGSQLHSILNYKNNVLSQSLNANCNVFGVNKVCAQLSLRQDSNSTNDELSSNSAQGAYTLVGAYQLQPNLSLGGLIDQADQELPSNYQDTRNEPTVGLFAAYSGTYAGREYTAKLSAAYNNENYNITRDVLTNTEAGTGSSSIASEGIQLEVVTALPSYQGIALTGVAKLNYKNSNRAGYVETSAVDFPVTYSAVEHDAVTNELNLYGEKKLANQWLAGGYIGLEHDLSNKISSYDATGQYINSVSLTPQVLNTTRYAAGLYSIYALQPNQHIKLLLSYRDAPFLSEGLTSTAIQFVTAF